VIASARTLHYRACATVNVTPAHDVPAPLRVPYFWARAEKLSRSNEMRRAVCFCTSIPLAMARSRSITSRSCHLALGRPIAAITDLLEQAFLAHASEIAARDADGGKVTRSHRASFACQGDCPGSER
jgi:hypothetical protein